MKKLAFLIVAMAALSMFAASVSIANIPAPPVNQNLGFDDEVFNDWTAAECELCHGSNTSDRHHFLYSGDMPAGICSATTDPDPRPCYQDADCVLTTAICSNSGDPCVVDADCPRQYQNPVCTTTPYCAGTSAAAKIDGSQNNDGVYGCLTCHEEETVGSVTNFLVQRDCMVCHEQLPNSPDVHHLDEAVVGAKAGNCKFCHGNIVDDMDDGHLIPSYTPSNVTPEPATTDLGCSDAGYGPAIPCSSDSDCTAAEAGVCEVGVLTDSGTCDPTTITGTCDAGALIEEGLCNQNWWTLCNDMVTPCDGTDHSVCPDLFAADTCSNSGIECTVDADCDLAGASACSNHGLACTADADCDVFAAGSACSNPGAAGDPCTVDADCDVEGATCEYIKADVARAGACNFCHDAGTDTASGVAVIDNHDTHHGTGVYKDRYGNTFDSAICSWCHYTGNPHNEGGYDPVSIRTCEGCHGMESLHSIQADSPNAGNIGSIVVGEEDFGWGHIGADDPNGDSDCTGCHGKVVDQSILNGDVKVVPTIDTTNTVTTIVANSDAQVTITGNAFTNDGYTSTIEVTPILGGDTIIITPSAISVDSITATINVAPGIYSLVADKSGVESNAIVLIAVSAKIEAIITELSCGDCKDGELTIDGSGFGAEIPTGVQSFMNVVQDGTELAIISWTDTQIVVSGYDCDGGPVTVNGLFGSATK